MQQTADAVAETKDLTIVDADLATILVSGLSYFFFAVVATAVALAVVASDAEMTACGLSSYCYSVAATDLETTVADAVADAHKSCQIK